jgi:hypothetical protein
MSLWEALVSLQQRTYGFALDASSHTYIHTYIQTSGTIAWNYKINTVALDGYHGQVAVARFVLEIILLVFFLFNVLMVSQCSSSTVCLLPTR